MKVTFPYRLAVAALFFLSSTATLAEEPRAKAVAPENHLQLKDTASGRSFSGVWSRSPAKRGCGF